jgi:hypothetical protein
MFCLGNGSEDSEGTSRLLVWQAAGEAGQYPDTVEHDAANVPHKQEGSRAFGDNSPRSAGQIR